ncbi:FAD-dependent oxidoreductase [Eleftheria terrae]|uniref:FAD-dependent oxidoreductase n=1 Tax=Eleftheria terrae TaxID=1597781 RepID=UPI00263AC718|nr:FAD-dependent oxidoreductase [Eleftheria terrae]WKB54248.1 glycosyltransferase [Eleftheria terrae]
MSGSPWPSAEQARLLQEGACNCPALASFWMGGFEGADHRNGRGEPLDMVRSTGHLQRLEADYASLARWGLRGARESIGWRLSEGAGGRIDLARTQRVAEAARRHGVQPLWTLMHYGMPADVDIFDDRFIARFVRFAEAVARTLKPLSELPPIYTPINEISFLAWAVSETSMMAPYLNGDAARADSTRASGYAVKRRLVRAALEAMQAMRAIDGRARFMHVEPVLHVVAPADRPDLQGLAAEVRGYQWQTWDLLAGRMEPELGGHEAALDLLGLNHYHNGQWEVGTERRLHWHLRDPRRLPFGSLVRETWERYRHPMIVAETSHVGVGRGQWLHEMATEAARVRAAGIPLEGLCLYPIVDRHDWDDPTHWHNSGLWDAAPPDTPLPAGCAPGRVLNRPYARVLRRWQRQLPACTTEGSPKMSRPCLLVFSHLRWDFVYQRPQHLLSRLAQQYRVLVVEEPVHDAGLPHLECFRPCEGVEVLRPHTPVEAAGFHDDQLPVLKPLVQRHIEAHGIDNYLVWFYTPMALPLLTGLQPRAVIYDCMDELSAFKYAPRQMRQRESALMKTADLVFTGGPSLYEAKREQHPQVHCFPSAVDAQHFAPGSALADPAHAAAAEQLQSHLPSPRLGFFGVIDERLDVELVAALADARPDWQLVMVGPVVKIDPAHLPRRANIHWLGQQSYARLPALVAGWDVCLLPFALNESTRFISPTKTLEYMAAEKPVVSTPIHDVVSLYGDVVRVGADRQAFIDACVAALGETPAQRQERVVAMSAVVARLSWDSTAKSIGRLIADALQRRTVATAGQPAATAAASLPTPAVPLAPGSAAAASAATPAVRAVRHVVIGAGPTGLAAAYHLGGDTLLVEREARVGGGCRSTEENGFTFGNAGHVMFSEDPEVHALYSKLLGDNLHWQTVRAAVHRDGCLAPFPLAGAHHGLPPDVLKEQRRPSASTRFGYPLRGGFQALMEAFLPHLQAQLSLNTRVVHVSPSQRTLRLDDGRTLQYETLVSTMPLPQLVAACGNEAPPEVQAAARGLRHLSVRCINLGVDRAALTDQHWIYYPEGTVFDRVFAQGNASPHCSPPGGFGLTCEIGYGPGRPLPCDGPALLERVVADCRRVGLLREDDRLLASSQVDLPGAWLVHDAAQAGQLALVRQWLGQFGIVLAGRYGEWAHDHAEHAFVAGRRAAQQALARSGAAAQTIAKAG